MDEEYIKMCREGVEIQEAWEPKKGDKAWDDLAHSLYILSTLEEAFGLISFIFWLPRQEDLQEIYMEKLYSPKFTSNEKYIKMLYAFEKYLRHNMNVLFELNDFNEIWLRFTMEEVYNKQWNGKTWEKI